MRAPRIGQESARPQELAWNIGTTGSTESYAVTVRHRGRARHHRMQEVRAMGIEHALRIAGRAGGVAEAGRGPLVELLPGEVAVDLADPILVGDGVLELGRRHVRAVGQNDVALNRRQTIGDRLHQRHEGQVDQHDPVFGVVDDPGDLLGEQARIDGVIDPADAGDAVPGFEMAIAVPGERRDAVAELDPVAIESLGDLERALRGCRDSWCNASALRPSARRPAARGTGWRRSR